MAGVLNNILGLVGRIAPSRPSNPLLAYVRLRAEGGTLTLHAANEQVDLEARLPWEGGPFDVLLPARLLVQQGHEAELLGLEGGKFRLRSGPVEAGLAYAEPEGFPAFPEVGEAFRLPVEALLEALDEVRYATAKEEYRAIFLGVQLEFSSRGFRAVASDGYRLALYDAPHPAAVEGRVVVPRKSVDELVYALSQAEGEVGVGLAPGMMVRQVGFAFRIQGAEVRLVTRLLEGEFPDYERVIPNTFAATVRVQASGLREALKRLAPLTDSGVRRVDVALKPGGLSVEVQGDHGEARAWLPASVEGEGTFAFNGKQLLEAVSPMEGEVRWDFAGGVNPTVIWQEGEGYRAVVVPLRT